MDSINIYNKTKNLKFNKKIMLTYLSNQYSNKLNDKMKFESIFFTKNNQENINE